MEQTIVGAAVGTTGAIVAVYSQSFFANSINGLFHTSVDIDSALSQSVPLSAKIVLSLAGLAGVNAKEVKQLLQSLRHSVHRKSTTE